MPANPLDAYRDVEKATLSQRDMEATVLTKAAMQLKALQDDWDGENRDSRLEDALNYNEPADWLLPTRHSLGVVLLAAGKAAEAEAVYRKDLELHPHNGWALIGLSQALAAQGKAAEAAEAKARLVVFSGGIDDGGQPAAG